MQCSIAFQEAITLARGLVPRLARLWVDGAFSGEALLKWVMETCGWIIKVVVRPEDVQGFVLLPKRWTVERTASWLHWCRQLNVDYERLSLRPKPSSTSP